MRKIITMLALVLALTLGGATAASAHDAQGWNRATVQMDLKYYYLDRGKKSVRVRCQPIPRSHVELDYYRHYTCRAGWGKSRKWFKTALYYHALDGPDYLWRADMQTFGWCRLGKRWVPVTHKRGRHILRCKKERGQL